MNKKIEEIEREYEGFKKDLSQLRNDFARQQGIKQSLLDRLEKEFNLKNQKEIETQLNKFVKEQGELIDKLEELRNKIRKNFSKVLED